MKQEVFHAESDSSHAMKKRKAHIGGSVEGDQTCLVGGLNGTGMDTSVVCVVGSEETGDSAPQMGVLERLQSHELLGPSWDLTDQLAHMVSDPVAGLDVDMQDFIQNSYLSD